MDVYHMTVNRTQHLQKVKEHYQNNKEEMQEKGRIKMAKRKNKQIDMLHEILEKVEKNLTEEEMTLLRSCIRKSYVTKKDWIIFPKKI